jgi:D-tyrosyl-tRNA(Tyr) deacylase
MKNKNKLYCVHLEFDSKSYFICVRTTSEEWAKNKAWRLLMRRIKTQSVIRCDLDDTEDIECLLDGIIVK